MQGGLVKETIEGLYEAFAAEPRPFVVDGCPCCISKSQLCKLTQSQLLELTPDDLSKSASSVFLTVGSDGDFRYFLPRILEISATDKFWWPDPEVIGRAIADAGWDGFSQTQQNAIRSFFETMVTELCQNSDAGLELDSWICAIAHSRLDVSRYLAIILESPTGLIAFYEQNSEAMLRGRLVN